MLKTDYLKIKVINDLIKVPFKDNLGYKFK